MFRKIKFVPNNYYHIYNRGTDKRNIFLEEADYLRFLILLFLCNDTMPLDIKKFFRQGRPLADIDIYNLRKGNILVDIGAYCPMPNHFHLLIKEKEAKKEVSGITTFMEKLCTAYAMYFNKKYERSGNLFQGRFKAELVDTDNYLKYLFAYIHLNPIKLIESNWKEEGVKNVAQAIEFLDNYQWSSYGFYVGKKAKDPILNAKEFPQYFKNFNEFKIFLDEWLKYQAK